MLPSQNEYQRCCLCKELFWKCYAIWNKRARLCYVNFRKISATRNGNYTQRFVSFRFHHLADQAPSATTLSSEIEKCDTTPAVLINLQISQGDTDVFCFSRISPLSKKQESFTERPKLERSSNGIAVY